MTEQLKPCNRCGTPDLCAKLGCASEVMGRASKGEAAPAMAELPPLPEPSLWVLPGDDGGRTSGFVDAMAWSDGEFTKPMFAAEKMREYAILARATGAPTTAKRIGEVQHNGDGTAYVYIQYTVPSDHTAPVAAGAAPVQPDMVLVPAEPTSAMVAAYLNANDAYWGRTDELPEPSAKWWRTGTPAEATTEGYKAMLAAAPREAPWCYAHGGPIGSAGAHCICGRTSCAFAGWSQADMDTLDDVSAILAPREAASAPVQPAKKHDDVLTRCEPCRWFGKMCDGTCEAAPAAAQAATRRDPDTGRPVTLPQPVSASDAMDRLGITEAAPAGVPSDLHDHLFIEQRGDGPWLVCVGKVHDTMEDAQLACRAWQRSSKCALAAAPSDLYARIMALPISTTVLDNPGQFLSRSDAFAAGHKEARHAAAELVRASVRADGYWKAMAFHYEAALRHLAENAWATRDWQYARDALGSKATATSVASHPAQATGGAAQ